nr:MAG TPA: hypothetical protein [Caudoviricetes sp.]
MISLLLYFCVAIVLLFYFDDANAMYITLPCKTKVITQHYFNIN